MKDEGPCSQGWTQMSISRANRPEEVTILTSYYFNAHGQETCLKLTHVQCQPHIWSDKKDENPLHSSLRWEPHLGCSSSRWFASASWQIVRGFWVFRTYTWQDRVQFNTCNQTLFVFQRRVKSVESKHLPITPLQTERSSRHAIPNSNKRAILPRT